MARAKINVGVRIAVITPAHTRALIKQQLSNIEMPVQRSDVQQCRSTNYLTIKIYLFSFQQSLHHRGMTIERCNMQR